MEMTLYTKLLILAGVLIVLCILGYNSLVRKRNQAENAFATIDVMLKKRFDLIPNLVATVKKYASHEQELFAEVTRLRSKDYATLTEGEKSELDNAFTQAGRNLLVIAESYPTLKASENFMHLQRTINETEEQLSAARRTFNASVTDYNNSVQSFPMNMIATLFGFRTRMLFHIDEEEKDVPSINL